MMLTNLRGIEESGALFAPPTYIYVASLILLIVVGLYRIYFQHLGPIDVEALVANGRPVTGGARAQQGNRGLDVLMLLRAFSIGARRAVGSGSGLERRACLPQARAEERGDDDRRSWA